MISNEECIAFTKSINSSTLQEGYGNMRNCHQKFTSVQLNIKISGSVIKTI